jgi:hypothetical protein
MVEQPISPFPSLQLQMIPVPFAQVTRRMPFQTVQWQSSVCVIESYEVLPSQQWPGRVENE